MAKSTPSQAFIAYDEANGVKPDSRLTGGDWTRSSTGIVPFAMSLLHSLQCTNMRAVEGKEGESFSIELFCMSPTIFPSVKTKPLNQNTHEKKEAGCQSSVSVSPAKDIIRPRIRPGGRPIWAESLRYSTHWSWTRRNMPMPMTGRTLVERDEEDDSPVKPEAHHR